MLFLSKLSNDPDFFRIAPILLDEAYMRYRSFSSSSGFQWERMCQNIEEYIPVLVMCHCQFPSAILIPGGDCHMKGAGMLVGNFELNP